MRCLIIAAVSVFALTPGAFAQTFPPSSLRAELTQDNIAGTLASVCRKLGTALKLSRLF